MQPYTDEHREGKKIRTFSANVESSELVWHRDRSHRQVKVLEGKGWFFQRDEEVPFELKEDTEFFITKMEWHRLFKAGDTDLVLEIVEKDIPSFKYVVEKELPKKYGSGLGDSTKDKRRAQFNKQAKMDDDNPAAYKPAPGDARAKTKPSKYTKAYHQKYGKKEDTDTKGWGTDELANSYKKATPGQSVEEKLDPKKHDAGDYIKDFMKSDSPQFKGKSKEKIRQMAIAAYLADKDSLTEKTIKGLEKKADETGIDYGILKKVYDRGMAAWRTGHRPGATPHQWAFARVNSFITGGKTQKTTDADLWAKHKGKKESVDLEEKFITPSPAIKQKLIKGAGLTSKTAEKILALPQPMLTSVINQLLSITASVQHEEAATCPPATQDIAINTKNRDATIKKYNYGPLNVDEPGDYWEKIAKYWDTTVEAAKKSECEHCVAFDISPRMLDCMPGETSDDDGVLGYCWMHHFKCHSARSCHTWAKGGPIDTDETSLDWGKRAGMNESEESVEEGVNDPAIFKAVFLAGGPGSGKSFTVGKTALTSLGFKIVNSDDKFEAALAKAGLEATPDNIYSPQGQALRGKAKELTAKQMGLYIQGRLGLVIDGTGKDYAKIKRQATALKKIGYDTSMIFVNTDLDTALKRNSERSRSLPDEKVKDMWNGVQSNLGKFQSLFGSNFIIVDNSEESNIEKATMSAYKKMSKFANAAPQNNVAKKWIASQLQEGEGKYKGETWEQGFERRVVKTTNPEHIEKGFKWRIKGKKRDEISIKLYKNKPDFKEYTKQMKRIAGHEFGG